MNSSRYNYVERCNCSHICYAWNIDRKFQLISRLCMLFVFIYCSRYVQRMQYAQSVIQQQLTMSYKTDTTSCGVNDLCVYSTLHEVFVYILGLNIFSEYKTT